MGVVVNGAGDRFESPLLVLGPSMETRDDDTFCRGLLTGAESDSRGVVAVTFNDSPSRYVERWRESGEPIPEHLAVISTRGEESVAEATVVEGVASPGDLTSLGMAISNVLGRLSGQCDSVAVCLDSLTVMLQYTERERVFRFVHTINKRFDLVDAEVHIHLDPVTQDDQVVATFANLANSAVRYDDGWEVVG